MGKYDNEYRHYYRRVSKNNDFIQPEENHEREFDYGYGNKNKNDTGSIVTYFFKGLFGTTIASIILFGGIIGIKYFLGAEGKRLYDNMKLTIEEKGNHKEAISKFISKLNISENVGKLSNKNNEKIKKEEEVKEELSNDSQTVSSFKLNNNSIVTKEEGEKIKSDDKRTVKIYSEVEELNNNIIFKDAHGEVIALLDGEVVAVSEDNGEQVVEIKYENELKGIYYNVGKAKVAKGEKIFSGEIIGQRESKGDVKLKMKKNEKYFSFKEYLNINHSKN